LIDIKRRDEIRRQIRELEDREVDGVAAFEDRELSIAEYLDLLVNGPYVEVDPVEN